MTDIRQLWIDGFGCLRNTEDPFCFERERINLFVDDNEAGKSTLQAALVAALYGLANDRRKSVADLRPRAEHCAPLAGPPFGLKLRLQVDKQSLEVAWTFGDAEELRITDLNTNQDVTAAVCANGQGLDLGRRLLGLTFEEFAKTCLVRHDELATVRSPENLVSLLERAADSQSGDTTVASAIKRLRHTLRHYPGLMLKDGGLIENEARRLEEDLEAQRRQLAQLEAEKEAVADQDAEFQRLAGERDDLLAELDRLDYLAQLAEHDELLDRIHKADQRQDVLARLQAELAELGNLEDFPADRAEQLTLWQAERQERMRESEQAEQSLAAQRDGVLEPARRELAGLGPLADVSPDDVDRLSELLGRVRDFEARERRLLDAIDALERKLARQGASVEELDRLEGRFADLDAADGQFLQDQETAAARIGSEMEEAKRLALEAQLRIDQVRESRRRERDAARRTVVTGGIAAGSGGVAGAILCVLHGFSAAFLVAGIVVLLGGLAAGVWLFYQGHRRAGHAGEVREDDLAEALAEVARLETRQTELAAAQGSHRTRLKALATECGYEQAEVLVDDYLALDELRRLCVDLIRLRGQAPDMAGERETVQADVTGRLTAYDRALSHGQALSEALEDLQTRLIRARTQRQVLEETGRKVDEES
ncbi:AAA family ATPase, partial [bacterium]|nr:AAA family ATPase [bacterium]